MKQILCFGDSNTYGYIPENGKRYAYADRWTGILSERLKDEDCRVIEEGLCGRTTVFEDELRIGRRWMNSVNIPAISRIPTPK